VQINAEVTLPAGDYLRINLLLNNPLYSSGQFDSVPYPGQAENGCGVGFFLDPTPHFSMSDATCMSQRVRALRRIQVRRLISIAVVALGPLLVMATVLALITLY
jgi:hypothetical protein